MEMQQLEPSLIVAYMEENWDKYPARYIRWLFHLGCQRNRNTRFVYRYGLTWLAYHRTLTLCTLLEQIPRYCCWSDLNTLLGTPVESCVISLYASTLETDKRILSRPPVIIHATHAPIPISLAAKWCPSQNSSIDRETNFTHKLCIQMGITAKQLRKNFLTPLRHTLHVAESLMCAGKWKEVDYSRVPRSALARYHKSFLQHDTLRYSNYIHAQQRRIPKVGPDLVDSCLSACYSWDSSINSFTGDVVGFQVRGMHKQRYNGTAATQKSEIPHIVVDCSGSCIGIVISVATSLIALLGATSWQRLGDAQSHPTEMDTGSILKSMLSSSGISPGTEAIPPSILTLLGSGGNCSTSIEGNKDRSTTILVLSDLAANHSLCELEKLPASHRLIHWCCCNEVVRFRTHNTHMQITGYDTHLFNAITRHPTDIRIEHYLQAIENDPKYANLGPLLPPIHSNLESK